MIHLFSLIKGDDTNTNKTLAKLLMRSHLKHFAKHMARKHLFTLLVCNHILLPFDKLQDIKSQ